MNNKISIAIDGPAGSGKSTIAKIVGEKLNIEYVDTGAMYRALTLKILSKGVSFKDIESIVKILKETSINFINNHIYLDGKKIDKQIRDNIISKNVSNIAKIKDVREQMVEIQQKIAKEKSIIMDGRDIGTVVLPNADYKFYITASIEERAKRRYLDLIHKGDKETSISQIKKEIEERDKLDRTREIGPLAKSTDAYEIDTTGKTIDESVNEVLKIIDRR